MTKRDYILIAKAVMDFRNETTDVDDIADRIAEYLGRALVGDNIRFDYNKFIRACGVKDRDN